MGPPRQRIVGVCVPARAAALASLFAAHPASVWVVVTGDPRETGRLADDLALFGASTGGAAAVETVVFPESAADSPDMREAFAASSERLTVLARLRQRTGRPLAVVTTPAALLHPIPGIAQLEARELIIERGAGIGFTALLERLRELDYDCEAVCESPGHYAIRGGIVDVYPVTAPRPYRLDFFGDEIEDIRDFDPVTQRSGGRADRISVPASPRVRLESSHTGLADYLPPDARLALIEPAALAVEIAALAPESGPGLQAGGGLEPLFGRCAAVFGLGDLDEASDLFPDDPSPAAWDTESLVHHRTFPPDSLVAHERVHAEEEARRAFLDRLAAWRRDGYGVAFVASAAGERKRIAELVEAHPDFEDRSTGTGGPGPSTRARTAAARARGAPPPVYLEGRLNEGFRITRRAEGPASLPFSPGEKGLVVVTETEVFGRKRPRREALPAGPAGAARARVDQLLDFSELVEGDYVVHLQHGVALFRGLAKIDTAQGAREMISIEFDDGVILHVPLQESHLVSRYVGLGKTRPQLGRIGSGRWEKTRRAAELATVDLAAELLRIQASREAQPGFACPADTDWQREFEGSFPFVETPGQMRAIQEAKKDMERTRPMDRLVCGDVGFGKTEVAIRAAFKAVQAGRQVAILVPTTILAQQHFNTFRERMAGYPVTVEMLSRFRSRAETAKILAAAATGAVDILIGTHRLLQRDVVLKNLGLLVIDEEQRFGVRHKEVFKRMRATVDVLSMSATPIPRTLYLALTGARDLSVIDTAPVNRHPIQTIVKTYDEKVVVDAVHHEVRRGGQVFYLHNRVATIGVVAGRLQALLPGISIGVGHGQMDAADLERVMTDFVAGRYQVLVCTTIIESGLDIANCNTLIIEGADRFGLSQLYQLRGRVGRFKHQAYAYLLLHRHARILDAARNRLAALRQHTQLGAGFKIAMRDLELRGAGNLLGSEQSGHIVGVGFELYCQLLRQSVARLKGDKTAAAIRASVKLDFVFIGEGDRDGGHGRGRRDDGYTALKEAEDAELGPPPAPVRAGIPPAYIAETRLRIDFYRRLAMAETLPLLGQIHEELSDRFGEPPAETRTLLQVTEIRIRAEQKGIVSVETDANRLRCLRGSGRPEDWVMEGSRFPRLTARKPNLRLKEIIAFLNKLPSPCP